MRVIDKNNSKPEIVDTILRYAKYQKVVVCLDEYSDMKFINELISLIDKKTIVIKYHYNINNMNDFFNTINNGVRVVVYNVSTQHFYEMQNDNNYLLNIFLPQSSFLLPYITNAESVYGDNLLVCNIDEKDYTTLLFLYELGLYNVWTSIVRGERINTDVLKNIDDIVNNNSDFNLKVINQTIALKRQLDNGYREVEVNQIPYYLYLKLYSILTMLERVENRNEQYIDFYKLQMSSEDVNKAYLLIVKNDIINTLKLNANNLTKIIIAILNRFKIIIKKYFNFKNIKFNKLNKIIKNNSKLLNIDNLLYISYIFNCV